MKKDNLEVEEIIVNKTLIALQLKSQILHNIGHSSSYFLESFQKFIMSDTSIGLTFSPTDYAMFSQSEKKR